MARIRQECTVEIVASENASNEDGTSSTSSNRVSNEVITLKTTINCRDIKIEHSQNVTIGNSICYNGPVTVIRYNTPGDQTNESDSDDLLDKFSDINIKDNPTPYQKRLVKHFEWRGLAPRRCPCPLVTSPACYVVIGHTVCKNYTKREDCEQQVRNIQHFHFSLGYNDIAYNFLVGGDGFIYEGVGWDHIGSHTKFFNGESIGIAFIGTFIDVLPPARQMEAAKALIEEGVRLGKLTPDYKLFLQSQLRSTESPGARLAEEIKTWPHWTEYNEVLYPRIVSSGP